MGAENVKNNQVGLGWGIFGAAIGGTVAGGIAGCQEILRGSPMKVASREIIAWALISTIVGIPTSWMTRRFMKKDEGENSQTPFLGLADMAILSQVIIQFGGGGIIARLFNPTVHSFREAFRVTCKNPHSLGAFGSAIFVGLCVAGALSFGEMCRLAWVSAQTARELPK
ncbi:MAG: hypothetical protein HYT76_09525 [Deltaproteobacteria bacterium]|nr:hypothetical protein [Deltaproteobacteria bacterium]